MVVSVSVSVVWQGTWTSVWSGVSLTCGGALTLHALLAAPEYRWAPEHLARLLYSASVSFHSIHYKSLHF
jgi:hypothetical protein